MRRLLLIPVAMLLIGAAKYDPVAYERAQQDSINYREVSLVAVLANPAAFDGKRLHLSGYLTLGFEDAGLHLDKTAYEAGLRKNALRIYPPKWMAKQERGRFSEHYAEVFATFKAHDAVMGDHDLYSGTLTEVERIHLSYTTADFKAWKFRNRDAYFRQQLRPGLVLALIIAVVATLIARAIIRRQSKA